jgi:hypothetical protein
LINNLNNKIELKNVLEIFKKNSWDIYYLTERVRNSHQVAKATQFLNEFLAIANIDHKLHKTLKCHTSKLYQTQFPLYYTTFASSSSSLELKYAQVICDLIRHKNIEPKRILVIIENFKLFDLGALDKSLQELFPGEGKDGARCPYLLINNVTDQFSPQTFSKGYSFGEILDQVEDIFKQHDELNSKSSSIISMDNFLRLLQGSAKKSQLLSKQLAIIGRVLWNKLTSNNHENCGPFTLYHILNAIKELRQLETPKTSGKYRKMVDVTAAIGFVSITDRQSMHGTESDIIIACDDYMPGCERSPKLFITWLLLQWYLTRAKVSAVFIVQDCHPQLKEMIQILEKSLNFEEYQIQSGNQRFIR